MFLKLQYAGVPIQQCGAHKPRASDTYEKLQASVLHWFAGEAGCSIFFLSDCQKYSVSSFAQTQRWTFIWGKRESVRYNRKNASLFLITLLGYTFILIHSKKKKTPHKSV